MLECSEDERARAEALLSGDKEWDAGFAADLLNRNREALKGLDACMARPHLQPPEVKGPETPLAYLHKWHILAQLALVRAMELDRDGEHAHAFEQAMVVVEFGHKIEGCGASEVHYVVGMAAKKSGLACVRRMLPKTTLSSGRLTGFARRLGALGADEAGLRDAFRADYAVYTEVIQRTAAGEGPYAPPYELGEDDWRGYKFELGTTFKPNATRHMLAAYCRGQLEQVPKTWVQMDFGFAERVAEYMPEPYGEVEMDNIVGRSLLALWLVRPRVTLAYKCRENVHVAATRTLLALRAYKLDHGRLPERLDELTPEYLESVPQDDFNGESLQYSRGLKEVWAESPVDIGTLERGPIMFPVEF